MKKVSLGSIIIWTALNALGCNSNTNPGKNYELINSLIQKGISYNATSKWDSAIGCFKQSLSMLKNMEPGIDLPKDTMFIRITAMTNEQLVWEYIMLRDTDNIIQYAKESIPWLKLYNKPLDLIFVEDMLSLNLLKKGNIAEAQKYITYIGPQIDSTGAEYIESEKLRFLEEIAGYLYKQIGDNIHAEYYHTDFIKRSLIMGKTSDTTVNPQTW